MVFARPDNFPEGFTRDRALHLPERTLTADGPSNAPRQQFFFERPLSREGITPSVVRSVLHYDSETGHFAWLHRDSRWLGSGRTAKAQLVAWNNKYAGKPALDTVDATGYLYGRIANMRFAAHRVAWAYHYGEWPDGPLDHINRNSKDNRIVNLRAVTSAQSSMNRSSGGEVPFFGVTKSRNKFRARVTVGRKRVWEGTFDTAESAAVERDKAALIFHGEYAALNFPSILQGDERVGPSSNAEPVARDFTFKAVIGEPSW